MRTRRSKAASEAFVPSPTAVTICLKTALIYCFFMHLNEERGLSRLTALAGIGWLVILFLVVLLDYASR